MKRYGCLLLISVLVSVGVSGVTSSVRGQANSERYANELSGYKFYETAKWRSLTPLVSTMADVRQVLGQPDEESDVSQFTKPYPGDTTAVSPVFTYELNSDWQLLVYFLKYGDCGCPNLRKTHGDLLYSLELLPKKPLNFKQIIFPPVFKPQAVTAVDARWNEFSDGTGLAYEVYTSKTPYGHERPGDLNRIVYGPAPDEIARAEAAAKPER
jgi:hypothetical protein